jgi:hypothetical protein
MKFKLGNIEIVLATFLSIFFIMALVQVIWPTVQRGSEAQASVAPVAPKVAVVPKPKNTRELRKYAGKAESLFEKAQKVHATIAGIKLNTASELENELRGDLAAFPTCPDPYYMTVDNGIRSAVGDLRSTAGDLTSLLEAKKMVLDATSNNVGAGLIDQAKAVEAATLDRIKTRIQQVGQKLQELKADKRLEELFEEIDN